MKRRWRRGRGMEAMRHRGFNSSGEIKGEVTLRLNILFASWLMMR